jgi:uncharacterized protein
MTDVPPREPQLAIHLYKDVDLKGAVVIDGFPSVGLVSTICANYLIDVLGLEQVGILDSPRFPTVSIVRNGVPMFPVRLYAGSGLCVFVSEFQPDKDLVRPIAEAILRFAIEHKCATIISPEGLVTDEPGEVHVYGIGATDPARDMLAKHKLDTFANGIITGVSGVLLALGKKAGFPAISLLAEANPGYPDARAAARVIEVIDELLEHVEIDVKPLFTEAENIERTLRMMQKQAKSAEGREDASPPMYG